MKELASYPTFFGEIKSVKEINLLYFFSQVEWLMTVCLINIQWQISYACPRYVKSIKSLMHFDFKDIIIDNFNL